MPRPRKRITMLVTVSVPANIAAAHARLEVKTLVADGCNYSLGSDEVKLISVRPIPKNRAAR